MIAMRFKEANEVICRISTVEDGYKALCAAVIAVACDDWLRAYRINDKMRMNTIEKFFKSQRFEMFSDGIEGAFLIRRLNDMAKTMEKNDKARTVCMYDKNGVLQNTYTSAAEAAEDFHGDCRSISRACKKGTICYGFYWGYSDGV